MSNTVIQIKRSQTTDVPASLAEGELAYSGNAASNGLFIGLPDGANTVTRIAGGKYGFLHQANTSNATHAVVEGGKLSANAVLITDANSSINEVRTAKLIINTSGNTTNEVTSISIFANTTQLGASAGGSNTELVTSDAIKTYVDAKTGAIGGALSNTHVAFSNGTVFQGSAALTFDYASNTLSVGNTVAVGANVSLSTSQLFIGNSSTNATVNSSTITILDVNANTVDVDYDVSVGSNVTLSTTGLNIGNSTVNTVITSSSIETEGTLDVANTATFRNGIDVSNTVISNVADPQNPYDAANRRYVDAVAEGLHVHAAVVAATPNTLAVISGGSVTYTNGTDGVGAKLTLGSPITAIDYVNLSTDNRVLVKNEANAVHNGIYTYSNSTVLTRATDFDSAVEIAGGDFLFVTGGNTYNSTGWVTIQEVTTVGTDPVIFTQFSGAGVFTAGDYLFLDGSEFNANANSASVASVLVARDADASFSANVITINTLSSTNATFSGPVSGITTLDAGNTTITGFANISGDLTAGGNASITGTLGTGNTTITGFANVTTTLAAGNTTITGFINTSSSGTFGGTLTVSDVTESSNTTTGSVTIAGGLGVAKKINTKEMAVGNTSVYTSVNGVSISTANVFATDTVNAAVLSVGGWVVANNGGVYTSGIVNADILAVGSHFRANTTQITGNVPINITNTASFGNTTINGFANVTSTLAAGNTTITGFANISSNVTVGGDLSIDGNTTIGNATADIVTINARVASAIVPSANTTHDLGTAALRFNNVYAYDVHSVLGTFTDVTVSGNLTVSGTLTTIDTDNLVVEDSLIKVARNNTSTDALDIGLFGTYGSGGPKYTGLFRDQSDSGIWKLFSGLATDPTTTIDTTDGGFTIATLQAFLKSGALVSNSSAVTITANSTISVDVTANTIAANVVTITGSSNNAIFYANASGSLTQLTLGSDGQVLQSNGTALVYAHLDGGTF